MATTISASDIKRVKGMGFLLNKGTDCFNARVLTVNGKISAEQASVLAEAARTFGSGELTFTVRMTVEVPGIPYDQIPAFQEFIAQAGLFTGGTGPLVRPVVSCKGTTCHFGLYDTFALSQKIHERFYLGYHAVKLPHKFKIACGGCPNNCAKPDINDLGIIGQRIPLPDYDACKGCKKCQIEAVCPVNAAKVVDGRIVVEEDKCIHCGRCTGKCPFHAFDDSVSGWKVCLGGRWGKKVGQGQPLGKIITTEEDLLNIVEKTILFYREQGQPGERFADTIARLGFDHVEHEILTDDIFARKETILKDET